MTGGRVPVDRGLTVSGLSKGFAGRGGWRALFEGLSFRLPAGVALRYTRDSADVAVDLRFADGTSLRDRLAESDAAGPQVVPLDAFAGWQVDAVVLEVVGAGTATRPTLR